MLMGTEPRHDEKEKGMGGGDIFKSRSKVAHDESLWKMSLDIE